MLCDNPAPRLKKWLSRLALPAILAAASPALAGELVLFETEGCPYCAAWSRDVGRGYANSDEARTLPLKRIDLRGPRPPGYERIRDIRLTPTFVALACGEEVGRIQGYSDSGQFWTQLEMILIKTKEHQARGGCS